MPLKITHVRNGVGGSNCLSVPEILCSTCEVTLFVYSAVWSQRARRVREGVLKRSKQVEKTPSNKHVVVHADEEAHYRRCNSHPSQVGVNCLPDADVSLAEPLADSELQEEQRYAKQDQAKKIWNEERT